MDLPSLLHETGLNGSGKGLVLNDVMNYHLLRLNMQAPFPSFFPYLVFEGFNGPCQIRDTKVAGTFPVKATIEWEC